MVCAFLPPAASGYSYREMVEKVAQNSNDERRRELFLVAKYRMTFDKMTSLRPDSKLHQSRDKECLSSIV
jgi:hypothetical protein